MNPDASSALPVKVLIALTGAVLLVHLLALQASPVAFGLTRVPDELPRAFTTRTIEPAPPRTPLADAAASPAVAAPAKPARPKRESQPAAVGQPTTAGPGNKSETALAPTEITQPEADKLEPALAAQTTESAPVETLPPPPAPRPPREAAQALKVYALPPSIRLSYTVQADKFPFSLNSELLWSHDGKNFEARLELSAFGQSRLQTSRGDIAPEGLEPLRFSDKFRSEVAAHFDRQKGKVTFSANTPDAALLAGAQDRLSILVQLAAMVASHPEAYPEATTIAIQTIGPRDADTWLFTVGQKEVLTLPGGEQTALKLVRNPRKEFDQRVELWLAPTMSYLPVRIRITEANGAYVDQKWRASHKNP